MKWCPDNQINASFIDISRIKWLVFYCGRLSSAQLVPLQAPKHRPIIGPHPVEQTAFHLYKFVAGTSTEQVVDKGLGKNPQKSELIHWQQCLLSGGTEACSLGLRETLARIHVIPQMSQLRVACWHSYWQNFQKTKCMLRRPPIGGWK